MSYSIETFLDGRAFVLGGDNLMVLADIADNSVDAVVTDGPYHLTSIVKRFGSQTAAPVIPGTTGVYARGSRGFMGKVWDGGDITFQASFWAEILRVLKPGGHLLSFGGTRTYHRMACAVEDAGFEIRDMVSWMYGTGFPKSHSVANGIHAARTVGSARTEDMRRIAMGEDYQPSGRGRANYDHGGGSAMNGTTERVDLCPEAAEWQGWGTALKPAVEPIVLARKPLSEKTVAANVLRWGTGALNIDAARLDASDQLRAGAGRLWSSYREDEASAERRYTENGSTNFALKPGPRGGDPMGRWPANLAHDGSDEVVGAFPDSKGQQGDLNATGRARPSKTCFGDMAAPLPHTARNDSGSAARFFYSAKASKIDRADSKHPTVKPVALIRWLCRLVTPPGGLVLDPFAGTGTTAAAANAEGFRCYLIEREEEYLADIRRRLSALDSIAVAG